MGGGVSTAVKQTVEENDAENITSNANSTSTKNKNDDTAINYDSDKKNSISSNNSEVMASLDSKKNSKSPNIETLLSTPRTPREIDGNPKQKFATSQRNNHQGGPPITFDNLSPTHDPFKSKYQLKRDEPLRAKENLKAENTYVEVIEGKTPSLIDDFEGSKNDSHEGKSNVHDIDDSNKHEASKVDEKVDDTNMMMLKSTSTFIDTNNDRTSPETLLVSHGDMNSNDSSQSLLLYNTNSSHNGSNKSLNSNNSTSNKSQFNRPVVHKRKKKKTENNK